MSIPIHLVARGRSSRLADVLSSRKQVRIDAIHDIRVNELGMLKPGQSPNFLVVIDLESMGSDAAVITSLLLRNAGQQVFISTVEDCDDLVQLLEDTYSFLEENRSQAVKTEVFVTDTALNKLGDVSRVVDYFEREFLVSRSQQKDDTI